MRKNDENLLPMRNISCRGGGEEKNVHVSPSRGRPILTSTLYFSFVNILKPFVICNCTLM